MNQNRKLTAARWRQLAVRPQKLWENTHAPGKSFVRNRICNGAGDGNRIGAD
jgi:hypothetical protein